MGITKEMFQDIDKPVDFKMELPTALQKFLKGRIKLCIIYPDNSAKVYSKKLKNPYFFTINKDTYFIVPNCFIYFKGATWGFWYYKNPKQVNFKYEVSNITSKDMYSEKQVAGMDDDEKSAISMLAFDTESFNVALTTRIFKSLYAHDGITTKQLLLILGAIVVVVLVLLQVTGTVDIMGGLQNAVIGNK